MTKSDWGLLSKRIPEEIKENWFYAGGITKKVGAYERKSWLLIVVVPTTVFFPAPRHMAAASNLGQAGVPITCQ